MKLNLKVRIRNKTFLLALFSAVTLLVTQICAAFGLDITVYNGVVTTIFNSALSLLVLLGVVIDPTTESINDSERAMKYK